MQEERKVTAKTEAESNKTLEEKAKLPAPFDAEDKAPFIFISYAHKDCELVYPIISKLYEDGYYVWYDEGIEINSNYHDVIANHIVDSAIFLMFLSKTACERKYCIDYELNFALDEKENSQIILCFLEEDLKLPNGVKMRIGARDNLYYEEVTINDLLSDPRAIFGEPPYKGEKRKAEGIKAPTNMKDAATKAEDEYTYEIVNRAARLTKYNGDAEHVEIPATWKGFPVVELSGTFQGNKILKSVTIPSSVQSIGYRAFSGCSSLQSITIPSRVQSIGYGAFSDCGSLQSITIPSRVQSISYSAFWGCSSLKNITIPSSVKSIGIWAFSDCSSLTITCEENSCAHQYAIKEKIPFVLAELPHDCVPTSPTAGNDTQKEENAPYVYCSYAPMDKVRVEPIIKELESEGYRVKYGMSRRGSQEWANTLVGCKYVLSFISAAYVNSDELTDLQLSPQEKHILYWLEDCDVPEWLTISHNSNQDIRSGSRTKNDRIALLQKLLKNNGCCEERRFIKDFDFIIDEKGVTLTKFRGKDSHVDILPEYFKGIPTVAINSAFSECSSLKSITIPNSVQSIGDHAFYGCSSLKSITIPGSVQSIGGSAFYGCSSLKSITIPNSVQSIGYRAFDRCKKLTVYCAEDSYAWQYCEKEEIPHKPLKKSLFSRIFGKKN